jgi:hypothetical protein
MQELAVLAFEANSRGDAAGAAAIVNSIPAKVFQTRGYDFVQHGLALTNLGMFYGIQYWKTRAMTLATDNISMVKKLLTQLSSMDRALADVCKGLKVDVESVKALAHCETEPVLDDADPEQIEQYSQTFMELFA